MTNLHYYVLSSTFVLAYGFTKYRSYYEMVMNQERLLLWLLPWENGLSGEQGEGESRERKKRKEAVEMLNTGAAVHCTETKMGALSLHKGVWLRGIWLLSQGIISNVIKI